jgi:hypothetical protein
MSFKSPQANLSTPSSAWCRGNPFLRLIMIVGIPMNNAFEDV